MRVALLIPPRYHGKWATREYKDGYFSQEPQIPHLAANILGLLREQLKNLEIKIIDAQLDNLSFDDVAERVKLIKPDIILCQMNIACMDQDRLFLEFPYPTIAITQAFIDHKFAIEYYNLKATYFTKREIEFTILQALEEFEQYGLIRKTAGLIIKNYNKLIDTGEQPIRDLSELPLPAFDLFDIDRYMYLNRKCTGRPPFIHFYTSRGCPFECKFCAPNDKAKITMRTPQQVLKEIEYFFAKGYRNFYPYDADFSIDIERAKEICRLIINKNLKISLVCNNSIYLVDEELLYLMRMAGFTLMRYGIETGDKKIQKIMQKEIDEEKAIKIVNLTKKYGMMVDIFIMVGFPNETRESLIQTYKLVKKLKPDRATFAILMPKPYSLFYYDLRKNNMLIEEDWTKYINPSRLTFRHNTYKSIEEVYKAEKWLKNKIKRYIAFRELFLNRSHKSLITRLIMFFYTFGLLKNVIRKNNVLYNFLNMRFQRSSTFEI